MVRTLAPDITDIFTHLLNPMLHLKLFLELLHAYHYTKQVYQNIVEFVCN